MEQKKNKKQIFEQEKLLDLFFKQVSFVTFVSLCLVCVSVDLPVIGMSSSLPSRLAAKRQTLVCVVWLHSDTSCPKVFSVQQTDFLMQLKPPSLCCHTAVTIHIGHPPAWQTQTYTTYCVCTCVCETKRESYLSIIPGNTTDVVPAPHVNDSIFIHDILLEQTLIREVHHII